MKSHLIRYAAFLAACACIALSPMQGCMSNDPSGTSIDTTDPFPRPLGQGLIPLDTDVYSGFRYVEFDGSGKERLRENLSLRIYPLGGPGNYAYAFDGQTQGLLLSRLDRGVDSTGVYIMGGFHDSSVTLDSVPVLWLPQNPHAGDSLFLGNGRVNVVEDVDTAFWTEPVEGLRRDAAAPVSLGLQRQPTVLFRETKGDTVTFYHFRRGVGCVGFERAIAGRLFAAGSLYRFSAYRF